MAEVVRFVEERIKEEDAKESHPLRGPYLARLELLHRLRERGCPEESLLGNHTHEKNTRRLLGVPLIQNFPLTQVNLWN